MGVHTTGICVRLHGILFVYNLTKDDLGIDWEDVPKNNFVF